MEILFCVQTNGNKVITTTDCVVVAYVTFGIDLICRSEKFDGLMQECSNSSALAMELLQSCTKPSK